MSGPLLFCYPHSFMQLGESRRTVLRIQMTVASGVFSRSLLKRPHFICVPLVSSKASIGDQPSSAVRWQPENSILGSRMVDLRIHMSCVGIYVRCGINEPMSWVLFAECGLLALHKQRCQVSKNMYLEKSVNKWMTRRWRPT